MVVRCAQINNQTFIVEWIEYTEEPQGYDGYIVEVTEIANRGWLYNPLDYTFSLDPVVFDEYMRKVIKEHRDTMINSGTLVYLTYDESGPNEESLGLYSDQRTLEAIGRKTKVAVLRDDPSYSVNYKFADFTPSGVGDAGYRDVDTSFIQNFYIQLDEINQKHFDAERTVLENHQTSAYDDVDVAISDFNNDIMSS